MTYPLHSNERCPIVTLDSKDIKYCQGIAGVRSKFDLWGNSSYAKGAMNSEEDITKAERLGAYGERAVSKFLGNIPMDETYRKRGDNGVDFLIGDIKIDVKFRISPILRWREKKLYGEHYLRASNERGGVHLFSNTDVFIFTLFREMKTKDGRILTSFEDFKHKLIDIDAQYLKVEIVGYIKTEKILENKDERIGPVLFDDKTGKIQNYYINKDELKPISQLVDVCTPLLKSIKRVSFSFNDIYGRIV